jgi:hypothetical protein
MIGQICIGTKAEDIDEVPCKVENYIILTKARRIDLHHAKLLRRYYLCYYKVLHDVTRLLR